MAEDLHLRRPVEVGGLDRPSGGAEDEIDEHFSVVRFEEPLLRRPFGREPRLGERVERSFRVLLPDEEVHVVVGRRSAPRPGGEPAAEHERNARVAESGGRALHRLDELADLLRGLIRGHDAGIPVGRRAQPEFTCHRSRVSLPT